MDHVFSIKVMVCDYLEHRSVWYAKRYVKGRRVDNVYFYDLNPECCLSLAYIATHMLVEEIFNNAWTFHT